MSKRSTIAALLGMGSLLALLFKLPGVLEAFGLEGCPSCSRGSPYLLMLAAGYFAAFITFVLSFSSSIKRPVALGGVVWSVGLALVLTYSAPEKCGPCLIAHAFHILAWIALLLVPQEVEEENRSLIGLKFSLLFIAPLAAIALFSTLNTTFLVYGLMKENFLFSKLKVGDTLPPFDLSKEGVSHFSSEKLKEYRGAVITFVAPDCPYCKRLLPELEKLAQAHKEEKIAFVMVGRRPPSEWVGPAPDLIQLEDPQGTLFSLFGVTGYPTTFVLDSESRVLKVIAGAPDDFANQLNSLPIIALDSK